VNQNNYTKANITYPMSYYIYVGFNDPKSASQIYHGLQGVWVTDRGG